ncbi:hypothetical protein JVT61DRAFT_15371 [Boletus reticuloceps]|uniref:Uncharacterized protein n=1 Tax=Boletus reticuloceps TaxID=495285 RepID=A0A8I3ACJ1_9AGAM|nr:hypothetical protein JVT61DRAFT_15371 [Boletus reticuloceps]
MALGYNYSAHLSSTSGCTKKYRFICANRDGNNLLCTRLSFGTVNAALAHLDNLVTGTSSSSLPACFFGAGGSRYTGMSAERQLLNPDAVQGPGQNIFWFDARRRKTEFLHSTITFDAEAQALLESVERRRNDLSTFQIPRLRACTGLLATQQAWAAEIREDIEQLAKQVEVSSLDPAIMTNVE